MSNFYIQATKISYTFDEINFLFENLSCFFSSSDRVGLIGDNGAGKTTFIKILAQEIEPISGKVSQKGALSIMSQEFDDYKTIKLFISSLDVKQKSEFYKNLKLFNLNVNKVCFSELSGGEKQKLFLAKVFAEKSDLLILDEPTNNLDKEAKQILFDLVQQFSGGILVVSHDRELLNNMNKIWEISQKKLFTFGGNYSFYQREKSKIKKAIKQDIVDAEKVKRRAVKKLDETMQRSAKKIAQGKKAKQNSSGKNVYKVGRSKKVLSKKLKKLEKQKNKANTEQYTLELSLKEEKIKVPLPKKPFLRNKILEIKDMSFGYEKMIFDEFNLFIKGGEKVLIQGENGTGKTTLFRLILGSLKQQKGSISLFGNAVYLDQFLSLLLPKMTLLDFFMEVHSSAIENEAYATLAKLGFRNVATQKKIKELSGGQKLRVALSVILGTQNQPDLLILDEPTNNLDINSMDILADALNQYKGSLLVVSHDLMFVNKIVFDKTIGL